MEDYIYEMLKILHEYNTMEYSVLSEMYAELHFVTEDFNNAFESLKSSGFLMIKPADADDAVVLKITQAGKAEYEFEKKRRHAGFAQTIVERSANISQDKLNEVNMRAAEKQVELLESQIKLNPLIEEANQSAIMTNIHTRQTNKILVVIFLIISVFALFSVVFSFLSYKTQDDKNNLKKDSDGGMAQFQMQNRLLQEKDDVISHQKFVIDSLKASMTQPKRVIMSQN